MNTLEAIAARRSIRKFKDRPITDDQLQTILKAGSLAPSAKNRQPWRFVVVKEDKRAEMVKIFQEAIARSKARDEDIGSSEWSANVMEQASVSIFVINPEGLPPWLAHSIEQNYSDVLDIQSIGAAIQNMLLAAQDLGLGSLWICDVFYAYEELLSWFGEKGELVAAVSFGYANENPAHRSRKPFSEIVRMI